MSKKLSGQAREIMEGLYKEYELAKEHVFTHPHYIIITRPGIDQIQLKAGIKVKFDLQAVSDDHSRVIIKATAQRYFPNYKTAPEGGAMDSFGNHIPEGEKYEAGGEIKEVETFGESAPNNNKNAYNVAMAEKRALSRAVLKLSGLYAVPGLMSMDEYKGSVEEEWKEQNQKESKSKIQEKKM